MKPLRGGMCPQNAPPRPGSSQRKPRQGAWLGRRGAEVPGSVSNLTRFLPGCPRTRPESWCSRGQRRPAAEPVATPLRSRTAPARRASRPASGALRAAAPKDHGLTGLSWSSWPDDSDGSPSPWGADRSGVPPPPPSFAHPREFSGVVRGLRGAHRREVGGRTSEGRASGRSMRSTRSAQ